MITKKYLEKEKEGKQQCQNCLEFGHWTYECTRPQTYVYRPSRTKLFKQNKFNLFEIKEEKKEEIMIKIKKKKVDQIVDQIHIIHLQIKINHIHPGVHRMIEVEVIHPQVVVRVSVEVGIRKTLLKKGMK